MSLRWLSVTLWVIVAAVTAWAVAARPAAISRSELIYEPMLVYELPPGQSATYIVPGDVERARVISRSAVPERGVERISDPLDYRVQVAWLDGDRDPVLEQTFWESTWTTRMPGPGLSPWQNAWLQDVSTQVTDDRSSTLPIQSVIPRGGYLRITAPEDGDTLYVRVYGEQVRGRIDANLALFGPTSELQEGLLHRIGLPEWSLLDRGERRALASTLWITLAPDATTRERIEPRWVMRSELRLSVQEQRLAWQLLDPERAAALNLVGPAEVRLSGQPEIRHLEATWIGVSDDLVVERPGEPVRFAGASQARVFRVPEGPGSLVFTNPTDRPVGPFWWTLDEVGPHTLFGRTAASRIRDMAPPDTWTGEDAVLVGPEWNMLDVWRASDERDLAWTGAWPQGGDVLQLQVRAVLAGPDDTRARTLRVTGWDALGRKVWSDAATFEPEPAPFEYLVGSDAWIAEPLRTWVPVDARVRRITVNTRDDLLLTMRAEGAPQGDEDFYPLQDERLAVRYARRPVTRWRSLEPEGELPDEQRVRVAANVRLEPTGIYSEEHDTDRYYTTLVPASAPRPDRIWLVPPAEPVDPRARSLYCAFRPGTHAFSRSAEAVTRLDGVLSGILWTPGARSLGAPYRVALDGGTWAEGRLAQRVYRFRTGREGPARRVTFEGPPGSTLWLRTWGVPEEGCPDPHEGRRYWHLDPGERLVFEVDRTLERQVFAVAALGPPGATLWIHIDDGQTLTTGLHPSWTRKQRELDLVVREGQRTAWPVDDPDTTALVLQPRGLVLASNLVGTAYRITVQNLSTAPIYARGLLETSEPRPGNYGVEELGLIRVDAGRGAP